MERNRDGLWQCPDCESTYVGDEAPDPCPECSGWTKLDDGLWIHATCGSRIPSDGDGSPEPCSVCEQIQRHRDAVSEVLEGDDFTEGEKRLLMQKLGMGTDWTAALFNLIWISDEYNRQRLAQAFPEEVSAADRWNYEDLATVWRDRGIQI